ncbi:tetratricopeptide repeat protein [Streptomyces sp. NRRL S-87]|uniref:tetratricopeptide repeat protein n=1 Tax=Streptomyces sp. NRRL S-87 TaxID=1463920 RepID=UPI0004BE4FCF|nr:tetratricopeptide repeat protein [Streptomyces sp. NRRL S-87]
MIEELLQAIVDSGVDVGTEELADILWLSARVTTTPRSSEATPGDGVDAMDAEAPERKPPPVGAPAREPALGPRTRTQLFAASDEGAPEGGRRGNLVEVGRAVALDDVLAMMRALRPVGRRRVGGNLTELDEELTVVRSIEEHMLIPVLRPERGHWLDLALVVDTHQSMLLWQDLVDELCRVISQTGVFRDVRVWFLRGTDSDGPPVVSHTADGRPRSPHEISDPSGRRVILVVSDTVGAGWGTSAVEDVLRHWSVHNSVAVLNVLPERLWTRGAARPAPLLVRAPTAAAPNVSWQLAPVSRRRYRRHGGLRLARITAVPVVEAVPESLSCLAHLLVGNSRWTRMSCLRLDGRAEPGTVSGSGVRADATGDQPGQAASADPRHVLARFREGASPTAQELAGYLSAVPLTLPVMTLVRRAMIPHSKNAHLAEVVLGGLFQPWHTGPGKIDPTRLEFQFLPGVREALVGSQLREEISAVHELVRRSVWDYLTLHQGPTGHFPATEITSSDAGDRTVGSEALAFAEAAAGAAAPTEPPETSGVVPHPVSPVTQEQQSPSHPAELSADRVVMVTASAGQQTTVGTGFLLTRRLVLVPAHLVAGGSPVSVALTGGDGRIRCSTLWVHPDARHPAALLLADEDVGEAAGFGSLTPLRWGRIVRSTPLPVPCSVLGFPGRSDARTWVAGSVRPAGDAARERYAFVSSTAARERSRSKRREQWAGLAGAPVAAGDLLLGLVAASTFREVAQLEVLPVSVLLRDPDFVQIVTRHLGTPPRVEPVPGDLPVPTSRTVVLGGLESPADRDRLCLAVDVRVAGPGSGLRGSGRQPPQDHVFDAELRVRQMLEDVLGVAGVDATVAQGTEGAGPDFLGGLTPSTTTAESAGRIVLGLSDALATLNSSRSGRAHVCLGVAIAAEHAAGGSGDRRGDAVDEAVRMLGTATVRRRVQQGLDSKGRSRELVLAITGSVLDALVSQVGPDVSSDFTPIAADDPVLSRARAAVYSGDPSRLGRAAIGRAPQPGPARLTDPDQPSGVFDAAVEDVIAWRQLAREEPESHRPGLARALGALAAEATRLGRKEAALAVISEAVTVWAECAADAPDVFLDPLIDALREQSSVCRELSTTKPATYEPRLAESLHHLGRSLGELGRHDEGQVALAEAVAIYRKLSVTEAATYRPGLARSLHDLGRSLGELGQYEEGQAALAQAVELSRELSTAKPATYLPHFAESLKDLGRLLARAGRPEEAVAAVKLSIHTYRELAASRPEYLDPLDEALQDLSVLQRDGDTTG